MPAARGQERGTRRRQTWTKPSPKLRNPQVRQPSGWSTCSLKGSSRSAIEIGRMDLFEICNAWTVAFMKACQLGAFGMDGLQKNEKYVGKP